MAAAKSEKFEISDSEKAILNMMRNGGNGGKQKKGWNIPREECMITLWIKNWMKNYWKLLMKEM